MDINTHPFAILCYIAIGIGILICIHVVRSYREWKTAVHWPHTKGEVVDSQIAFHSSSSEGSPGEPRYFIRVRYQYTVNGRKYLSRRISLTRQTITCQYRSTAEIIQKQQYGQGQTIRVYYNPDKPQSATLDKSVNNKVLLLLFLGGLILPCFSLAAYGALFASKKSFLADMSNSLLGISLILLLGVCYVALRVPGERLIDKDLEE